MERWRTSSTWVGKGGWWDVDELDALFRRHGLKKRKVDVIRRCIRNRKSGKEMHRVWIQAIYEKESGVC